jgi:hypothetical protein
MTIPLTRCYRHEARPGDAAGGRHVLDAARPHAAENEGEDGESQPGWQAGPYREEDCQVAKAEWKVPDVLADAAELLSSTGPPPPAPSP